MTPILCKIILSLLQLLYLFYRPHDNERLEFLGDAIVEFVCRLGMIVLYC